VDLTHAGELFLERARVALAAADAAAATGRDLETAVVGSLRLGLDTCAPWGGTPALLEWFTNERSGVEFTVLEGYGGTLWRDLRDGRLDALLAPAAFSSADLRRLDLGSEPWVVLVGPGHPLAGIGPLSAEDLEGQRLAVTGHRDGAGYDRRITEILEDLGVSVEPVRAAPGPASHGLVLTGEAVALTTVPQNVHPDVMVRPLDSACRLSFDLLWRDETPSAALEEFIQIATERSQRGPLLRRPLAAVA
jgi:DNA-binding transcriptional LysR family regulator